MNRVSPLAVCIVAWMPALAAARTETLDGAGLHDPGPFVLPPIPTSFLAFSQEQSPPPTVETPEDRFGRAKQEYLSFSSGAAHNFSDAWDYNLRGAYSLFLIDDVELSFEANFWYFDQEGQDALGFNPSIVFRWHLIHPPDARWTFFTDVGIGLLAATDEVPDGGTWFNFTPRVGAGYTHQISDDGTRLQVGLRWHHISNARITGDRGNPARDGVVVYAGVMIPFR